MVAYIQARAVCSQHVIVIAVIHEMARHLGNRAALKFVLVNSTFAVVRQELSVGTPVRRLDHLVEFLEQRRLARFDIVNLQERLVARTVPDFARTLFERVRHAPAFAELVHLRHDLHGLCMRHLGAFLKALLERRLAAKHLVLVAVFNTRRRQRFHKRTRDIEQLDFDHVVQVLHANKTFRAKNRAVVLERRHHRCLEVRHLAIRISQIDPVRGIDTRAEFDAGALRLRNMIARATDLGVRQEQVRKSQAVNAQVQKRTTRKGGVTQALNMRKRHREFRLHAINAANLARQNPVAHHLHRRQKARPHSLAKKRPLFFGKGNRLRGKQRIRRKRLFDKQILATLKAKHYVVKMFRMRSRNVNQVDIGILGKFRIAAVRTLEPVFRRKLLGLF